MTIRTHDRERIALSEARVAAYLREHPDFFHRHPKLVAELAVPHPVDGAVSLIEYQVGVLRDENRKLRRQLHELVDIARDNDRLFARLQRLYLALMEADTLEDILDTVHEHMRCSFDCEAVALRLLRGEAVLADRGEYVAPDHPGLVRFHNLLHQGRPVCGRLNREQLAFLFGQAGEGLGSVVLIPLADDTREPLGLLAAGSADPTRFRPGMSTVFLGYLGETVSAAVARRLPRE